MAPLHIVKPGEPGSLADVKQAWAILAKGAPAVAHELVRIATEAESEFVRQQAAVAVLDRVGLGKVEGHVVSMVSQEPDDAGRQAVSVVAARLAAIAGHQQGAGGSAGTSWAPVLDAEADEDDVWVIDPDDPDDGSEGI